MNWLWVIVWYLSGLAAWPVVWARFRARHASRYAILEEHEPRSGADYANTMATASIFMGAAALPMTLFYTAGTGWKWR